MPKNTMARPCRKDARHRNPKKDVVRKAVRNETKRKTKNEKAGLEKDGCKRMERQSKEPRDLEAYCRGGQGPPRAVAPSGRTSLYTSPNVVSLGYPVILAPLQ